MTCTGREVGGLYYLDFAPRTLHTPWPLQSSLTPFQWHCHLGHLSLPILQRQVVGINNVHPFSVKLVSLAIIIMCLFGLIRLV